MHLIPTSRNPCKIKRNKVEIIIKLHKEIEMSNYLDKSKPIEKKMMLQYHIDGLMQENHNSIANALELHLPCTNPLIFNSCE